MQVRSTHLTLSPSKNRVPQERRNNSTSNVSSPSTIQWMQTSQNQVCLVDTAQPHQCIKRASSDRAVWRTLLLAEQAPADMPVAHNCQVMYLHSTIDLNAWHANTSWKPRTEVVGCRCPERHTLIIVEAGINLAEFQRFCCSASLGFYRRRA